MSEPHPAPEPADDARSDELPSLERVMVELRRVIVGQDRLVERLVVALVAGGHCLLEGPPGLAKTLAVHTLADTTGGLGVTLARADSAFARIDRLSARIEAGEGSLGRLLSDSTFVVRAEEVLLQMDLLFEDLRENPQRYVRLSIF